MTILAAAWDLVAEPLRQILRYDYLQHALLGGLLVAAVCATLGVFLVLRGLSLLGDGLGHVSFGGVALGLALGYSPILMALGFSIAGALAIHFLRDLRIVRSDTAIGILFTAGLAFGMLVVSGNNLVSSVTTYLFGTILGADPAELNIVLAVGAGLVLLVALFFKEFLYMAYSDDAARVAGLPVGALNTLFMALTAAGVVVAVRTVGVLVVSALLVVPAAASLQWARSFRMAIGLSIACGVTGVLAGFWLAIDGGFAVGPSIAIASCTIFGMAAGARIVAGRSTR